nr:unnamed protein product [Digitaria exilis]
MAPVQTKTTKAMNTALCIIVALIMASTLSAFGETETLCDPVKGECRATECTKECREKATKTKSMLTRVVCEKHSTPQECCCTFDDIDVDI